METVKEAETVTPDTTMYWVSIIYTCALLFLTLVGFSTHDWVVSWAGYVTALLITLSSWSYQKTSARPAKYIGYGLMSLNAIGIIVLAVYYLLHR
jgi:hypothetical protein